MERRADPRLAERDDGLKARSSDPSRFFVPAAGLRLRQWDDELVVYDARQARTHLLDAGAADVLQCLLQSPTALSLAELAQALLADPAGQAEALTDDERAGLAACVDELSRLGLVEPQRPS